jgi:hypothetical protein
MNFTRSSAVRIGILGVALGVLVVLDVTAALAQSSSRSRYSYQYSVPSDQQHWGDRNSTMFNS